MSRGAAVTVGAAGLLAGLGAALSVADAAAARLVGLARFCLGPEVLQAGRGGAPSVAGREAAFVLATVAGPILSAALAGALGAALLARGLARRRQERDDAVAGAPGGELGGTLALLSLAFAAGLLGTAWERASLVAAREAATIFVALPEALAAMGRVGLRVGTVTLLFGVAGLVLTRLRAEGGGDGRRARAGDGQAADPRLADEARRRARQAD